MLFRESLAIDGERRFLSRTLRECRSTAFSVIGDGSGSEDILDKVSDGG